jgi:ureidoacrylate peracid hydrolase
VSVVELDARYYRMFPVGSPGHVEERLELDLARTAFLVVDVYGKGYDPSAKAGDEPAWSAAQDLIYRDVVVGYIAPARDAARAASVPIVHLTNHLAPSTTERNEFRNMNLRTYGFDVLEAWREPAEALAYAGFIAPREGDFEIFKQHYSGFFETQLESLLKELGTRDLVIVGVDSRVCVGVTAMDALCRNYRVIVLRDCVCSYEFPETEAGQWANFIAIREIESVVGYTATRDAWVSALAGTR